MSVDSQRGQSAGRKEAKQKLIYIYSDLETQAELLIKMQMAGRRGSPAGTEIEYLIWMGEQATRLRVQHLLIYIM